MTAGVASDLEKAFADALGDLLPTQELLEAARHDKALPLAVRARIAGLGWTAAAVGEEEGGLGLVASDLAALAAVAGAHLLPLAMREEAFLLAPGLAAASARGDEACRQKLDGLLGGKAPGGGGAAGDGLAIEPAGDDVRVTSEGIVVWLTPGAEDFALVTPTAAAVLSASDPGVSARPVTALDLGQGAHVVDVDTVVPGTRAFGAAEASRWWQRWRLAALAGLVGCSSAVLEQAVEHASAREQFGRPIVRFQAVSHMLAEIKLRTELCRSAVSLLASAVEAGDAADLGAALAYAVPQMAREAVESSVQVHGGTGFTWEYGLHLYYRRVLQTQASFGGARRAAANAGLSFAAARR